jgi:hypothetical protein
MRWRGSDGEASAELDDEERTLAAAKLRRNFYQMLTWPVHDISWQISTMFNFTYSCREESGGNDVR